MRRLDFCRLFIFMILGLTVQPVQGWSVQPENSQIKVGAAQPGLYLELLKGKSVGLVVNQTSLVDGVHLIDYLLDHGVTITQIFAAEHGIRGQVEAGAEVVNGRDPKSGIPVISLYGNQKKPTPQHLAAVDIVVFDMQDVGCRFFTYISTMHYLMEACAENKKKIIILDRPNPNGDYIDGPVLDTTYRSFVGMHPIPVVHGCTVGELARMINGEHWLKGDVQVDLTVIPARNYTHTMSWSLPVRPSPNLPNDQSVRLYPSLCLFEATNVSIGRGTVYPFQVIGFPEKDLGPFSFTPVSIEGVSKNPPQLNKLCYGLDLRSIEPAPRFTLSYFLTFFQKIGDEQLFWNSRRWISLLMGQDDFYLQVNQGLTENEIRATWAPGLERYRKMRKQYLLYPDFE